MKHPGRLLVSLLLLAAPALSLPAQNPPALKLEKGDRLPIPKTQARPKYPAELRKKGITGTVQVHFVVTKEGKVVDAEATGSTHEAFSTAAVAAVSKWTYEPGRKHGVPVAVRLTVPVHFNLQEKPEKKPRP